MLGPVHQHQCLLCTETTLSILTQALAAELQAGTCGGAEQVTQTEHEPAVHDVHQLPEWLCQQHGGCSCVCQHAEQLPALQVISESLEQDHNDQEKDR